MNDHEAWLTDTFVELADTLTAEYDLVDFLFVLIERCGELLDSPEVGLVLADSRGRLQVMASLTERMRAIELFEIQNEEGPCLDAFRTGEPVALTSLGPEGEDRWPHFSAKARSLGYEGVLAMPMRLRDTVIGAVNVFVAHDRGLSPRGLRVAQALTDVATIGILQERAVSRSTELAEQLEGALHTRVVIEQAKGVLAERSPATRTAASGSSPRTWCTDACPATTCVAERASLSLRSGPSACGRRREVPEPLPDRPLPRPIGRALGSDHTRHE